MKPLLVVALGIILSGCATETPSAEDVREHFERGLSGQGHLVPIDRPDDPAARPNSELPGSN